MIDEGLVELLARRMGVSRGNRDVTKGHTGMTILQIARWNQILRTE